MYHCRPGIHLHLSGVLGQLAQHLPFLDGENDDHARGYLPNFEGTGRGHTNHSLTIEGSEYIVYVWKCMVGDRYKSWRCGVCLGIWGWTAHSITSDDHDNHE